MAGLPLVSSAAVVGYWSFDDGLPTSTAGTLSSSVNSPALDGAASNSGTGSTKPVFSNQMPGVEIQGSAGGATLNPSNGAALYFTNPDAPGNLNGTSGGRVDILDSGAGSPLKLESFTIEGFIKVEDFVNFAAIFTKNRVDANGSTWMIDTDNAGHLRARFDSQPLGSGNGTTGFNQSFIGTSALINDGLWHHIALTYDGPTRAANLYVDYARVAGGTVINPLVYDNSALRFGSSGGGRGFDGYMDEVRLSDTALAPTEFLSAVPEPSVVSLAMLGALVLGMHRRRRS